MLLRKLAVIAWALCAGSAALAETFPARPVTLVVPLGAGGAMDVIVRTMGAKLTERLGQPMIVENKTGGGTVTAAQFVAKAAPDGYTLLVAPSGTLTTNAVLYKTLPYDPVRDFVPVALYTKVPFVLVVNPSLPINNVADLVRYSKAGGALSYSSTGTGAVPHLATELLKSALGIEMTHVPYRGAPPALTDVVAGHVQLTFADPSLAPPMLKDGKVRALGASSLSRIGIMPDVPPLAEAGVPGFEAVSWHMVVAPAGTPPEVVEKLHAAFKAIGQLPEIQEKLVGMGLIPIDTPSVGDLRKFLEAEMTKWRQQVEKAGIAGSM
ncbi:MAG TPA: tripartite tricarboxylate transporter substrate binding protein [Pseudolabrys sp.]|nr:tripartite tricarboxylate transporter substrate binding protein [Pseudolabrys sp.]